MRAGARRSFLPQECPDLNWKAAFSRVYRVSDPGAGSPPGGGGLHGFGLPATTAAGVESLPPPLADAPGALRGPIAAFAEGAPPSSEELEYLFADGKVPCAQPVIAAGDADEPVRTLLAVKLCRLLPHLSEDRRDQVRVQTLQALEALARDQALRVREALAGAIKDVACAPPTVCLKLAYDVEQSVAEPILRCCMTLTDADLRAFISSKPKPWALAAIACRPRVSAPVAVAIHHTSDRYATGLLIDNTGAEIPEPTLATMVEEAREEPDWQARLARRPALPPRLALRLAEFVDKSVIDYLSGRRDIDGPTAREIVQVARRRLEWLEATDPDEPPAERALRLHRHHQLEEETICDALSWRQFDFVRCALALRAGVHPDLIDRILKSRSPRAVTALAWRSRLSMRAALRLQAEMAGIPSRDLLNARAGHDFPLAARDMAWELELFGLPPGSHLGLT